MVTAQTDLLEDWATIVGAQLADPVPNSNFQVCVLAG